jgi:D-aspartate ligase
VLVCCSARHEEEIFLKSKSIQPPAIVMNMFYTGLGIARSLGKRGIPVIGLSAQRGGYGNLTRYADVRLCPDSRQQPEDLFDFLMQLGRGSSGRGIVFPTRDDDIAFLDRYREELGKYFVLAIASHSVVETCLDKWETHQWAQRVGISTPSAWIVNGVEDIRRIMGEVRYPCVLKPVASFDWHKGQNWTLVGGRKAIGVDSRERLLEEYQAVSAAGQRVLVQEMVQGDDSQLFIAACFFNKESRLEAGFTARKLLQVPEGFGTGCIVQGVGCPEVLSLAERLLSAMRFTGIAEVEFKRNSSSGAFSLIEINARAWDQHRLGTCFGTDLIYLAYCEHAGLAAEPFAIERRLDGSPSNLKPGGGVKWIAEDAFAMEMLRRLLRSWRSALAQLHAAQGRRIFAIWSGDDPLPFLMWLARFAAKLVALSGRYLSTRIGRAVRSVFRSRKETDVYGIERTKSAS